MRSRLFRPLSLLILAAAIASPAVSAAATTPEGVEIRCEKNENHVFQCFYVDANGDLWEPPPPPPDPPAELNLGSDDRRVYNTGTQCFGEYYSDPCQSYSNYKTPDFGFADFNGSAWGFETGATQVSHTHATELHVEGNVYAGGDADNYFASSYSRFNITFDVDDDVRYELAWLFPGGLPDGEFYVSEDGNKIFEWGYSDGADDQMLIELIAGRSYRLYFYLDSRQVWGYDGTDYSITFSQVPEPATALLVGLGCAVLARRRRLQLGTRASI